MPGQTIFPYFDPSNATVHLPKVSRISFNSKSTEDKLQHLNIDGGIRVILSGKRI